MFLVCLIADCELWLANYSYWQASQSLSDLSFCAYFNQMRSNNDWAYYSTLNKVPRSSSDIGVSPDTDRALETQVQAIQKEIRVQ